jgi:hypothetical protein
MRISATVFCNCFERRRLREPPPVGCRLAVAEDGSLLCGSGDLFVQAAFVHWLRDRACDHEDGRLVHRLLGEHAEIAAVRAILEEISSRFSMMLSRVLHLGDGETAIIALRELPALRAEVIAFGDVRSQHPDTEKTVRKFESRLAELVECAMFAEKPIAFE